MQLRIFILAALTSLIFANSLKGQKIFQASDPQQIIFQSTGTLTGVKAAHHNPAGILDNPHGLFVSINNSPSLLWGKYKSKQEAINLNEYQIQQSQWLVPTVDIVYVKRKIGAFITFHPARQWGKLLMNDGFPETESAMADLTTALTKNGIPTTTYSMTSQAVIQNHSYIGRVGGTYEINKKLSLSAGLQYVALYTNAEIKAQNVQINPNFIPFTGSFVNVGSALQQLGYPDWGKQTIGFENAEEVLGFGISPFINAFYVYDNKWNFSARFDYTLSADTSHTETSNNIHRLIQPIKQSPGIQLGASYLHTENWYFSSSLSLLLPGKANYGKGEFSNKLGMELGLGAIYSLNKKASCSFGYRFEYPGVKEGHSSPTRLFIPSHFVGGGITYKCSDRLNINSGVQFAYSPISKDTYTGYYSKEDYSVEYSAMNVILTVGLTYMY
jgi:hypothetical protein